MPARFSATAISAAAFAVALASAALSQAPSVPSPGGPSRGWVEPPSELPRTFGDQMRDLDFLFGALKAAPDESSAKAIEGRIWAQWLISKSDTTNLLMSRVKKATEGKDFDLALQLLDIIIQLNPDYVEGWNRRATLYYMRKDFGSSLADIRAVLALEPRHFGALTGLGLILKEFGQERQALSAFRKALEVNPHLDRIPDMVESLAEKVEGRDI